MSSYPWAYCFLRFYHVIISLLNFFILQNSGLAVNLLCVILRHMRIGSGDSAGGCQRDAISVCGLYCMGRMWPLLKATNEIFESPGSALPASRAGLTKECVRKLLSRKEIGYGFAQARQPMVQHKIKQRKIRFKGLTSRGYRWYR